MNTDPKFSTHLDTQTEPPKTDAGAPTTRPSMTTRGAGPDTPGPEYYNIAAGDGDDDRPDKPDDMMGAVARAVIEREAAIGQQVRKAPSLAATGLNRSEPYNLQGVAGSSNDVRPGLIAPLYAGNGGPKQPPPGDGGVSVSAATTPVQTDVPMKKLVLTYKTGKSSQTTGPRKRLNKKTHQQHHT